MQLWPYGMEINYSVANSSGESNLASTGKRSMHKSLANSLAQLAEAVYNLKAMCVDNQGRSDHTCR